jgi:chemotaxis protein methyltransferase CheR
MGPEFAYVATLLRQRSGLSLPEAKQDFVTRRLQPLAERHGFTDWRGLIEEARRGNEQLERALVESLTTRDTWFFRDPADFAAFRDTMLPKLMEARRADRRLRIWCAGSASGQEPYSLAMILDDLHLFETWDIEILATDLSEQAIHRGQLGLYSQAEVQRGLSPPMLAKYVRQDSHGWWIDDALRRRVQFRVQNLLHAFSHLGRFDVIFCRNVLMYFDTATKEDVARRLCQRLAGDGHLVLGAAESLDGLQSPYEDERRVLGSRRVSSPRWDLSQPSA